MPAKKTATKEVKSTPSDVKPTTDAATNLDTKDASQSTNASASSSATDVSNTPPPAVHSEVVNVFDADFEARALRAAITAHHANQGYCLSIGDSSQLHWDSAPEWQRQSALKGSRGILSGEITGPGASHESWLREKKETGWKYGPVKDEKKKEHPCFVPFDKLPQEQQLKDHIFFAVVSAFRVTT